MLGGAALVDGALGDVATPSAQAQSGLPTGGSVRHRVPEIFRPRPRPPGYAPVVIIGSGYGAAFAAWVLANAAIPLVILERGSWWPHDPWRAIFAHELYPDERAFWHERGWAPYNNSLPGMVGARYLGGDFGGVLDNEWSVGNTLNAVSAACVGGGSQLNAGITLPPQRYWLQHALGDSADLDEMYRVGPHVERMLRAEVVPPDIRASTPFRNHENFEAMMRQAGFQRSQFRPAITFNMDEVRKELRGEIPKDVIIGRSTLGNRGFAMRTLDATVLADAREIARKKGSFFGLYAGQEVREITADRDGGYTLHVWDQTPDRAQVREHDMKCDVLIMSAGAVSTGKMLVHARDTKTLPRLNEHVGRGFTGNGDVAAVFGVKPAIPGSSTPCLVTAGYHTEVDGLPWTIEGAWIPGGEIAGVGVDLNAMIALGMDKDPQDEGYFATDPADGQVKLHWDPLYSQHLQDRIRPLLAHVREHNLGTVPVPAATNLDAYDKLTVHPAGSMLPDRTRRPGATDRGDQCHGHPNLYVNDSSQIRHAGGANPTWTIATHTLVKTRQALTKIAHKVNGKVVRF